jgi:putative colanic acid biosynthesis acetyltransferase WcaF
MSKVNLSEYKNSLSKGNQIKRFVWSIVWFLCARPFPRNVASTWKLFLLRLFGAKIHKTANVYSTVKIYAPWNLEMHAYSCLAPEVDCYNVDKITIGANSTISQKSYLCSASHDITKRDNPLITAPIIIKDQVWVGADVFISMGVIVKQGAVIGATSSIYKNVDAWTVVGGNPAKFIKKRIIDNE